MQKQQINFKKISQKLRRAQNLAVIQISNDIAEDSRNFMPMNTGKLQSSCHITTENQSATVSWDAPYAKAVYYGDGQGRLWFEAAKAAHSNKWLQAVCEAFIAGMVRD